MPLTPQASPKMKVPTDPEAKKWFDEVQRQAQKIDHLLQLHELKERTIEKLSKRLEHSLQMLKAVQEMYEQQQRVIAAQQQVIEEFQAEGGDEDEAEAEPPAPAARPQRQPPSPQRQPPSPQRQQPPSPQQAARPPAAMQVANLGGPAGNGPAGMGAMGPAGLQAMLAQMSQQLDGAAGGGDDDMGDGDEEGSPEQQIQKMLALVQEVEQMRKLLVMAKAEADAEGGAPAEPDPPMATEVLEDEYDDDAGPSPEQQSELQKLLHNLQVVEEEKKRTQRELMAAQEEQESMVRKLSEMKAMMSALDQEARRQG